MKRAIKSIRNKRCQAAMEFLMTYGWAILVVLAAIGALAYFGVLNPSRFIPETCTLPPTSGIACLDFNVAPTSAQIFMMNGGGRDLSITSVAVGNCSKNISVSFTDGASMLFNITGCSFGAVGSKVKEDLTVIYTESISGFTKSVTGSLTAKVY